MLPRDGEGIRIPARRILRTSVRIPALPFTRLFLTCKMGMTILLCLLTTWKDYMGQVPDRSWVTEKCVSPPQELMPVAY